MSSVPPKGGNGKKVIVAKSLVLPCQAISWWEKLLLISIFGLSSIFHQYFFRGLSWIIMLALFFDIDKEMGGGEIYHWSSPCQIKYLIVPIGLFLIR